jgi:hypothetical protein
MDAQGLKAEVDKVIQTIEADANPFLFVGLTPTYPGLVADSYILQLGADWLDRYASTAELDYVIKRLYAMMPPEAIRQINRIELLDEDSQLNGLTEDLVLRNELSHKLVKLHVD